MCYKAVQGLCVGCADLCRGVQGVCYRVIRGVCYRGVQDFV